MLMDHINPDCKILSVDIASGVTPELKANGRLSKLGSRIQFVTGNSVSKRTIDIFSQAVTNEGNVWVSLDGSHAKDTVLEELKAYAPLVPVGCYVLVQDTRLGRGWHTSASNDYVKKMHRTRSGPYDAVEEFLAGEGRGRFERVVAAKRLLISNSGGGWLRRVA